MQKVPFDPEYEPKPKQAGGAWLITASTAAIAWVGFSAGGLYAQFGAEGLARLGAGETAGAAAMAFGPALLLLFTGLAAREAARARAKSEQVVDIAGRLRFEAANVNASGAIEDSRTLRGEIVALDGVVRAAGQRIDHFRATLQKDGGALAYALKADIEAMRAVRAELAEESQALAGAMSANLDMLRDANGRMKEAASALGAAFGQIGARSAEFAAAAEAGQSSSEIFDRAVHNALEGLSHATSLNECARKSVVETTALAHEAARALKDVTARTVEDMRHAARDVRAGAPAPASPAQTFAESFTGRHEPANLEPTPMKLSSVLDLLRLKPAPKPEPLPAPANDHKPPRATLADIVRLAGLRSGQTLSPHDLARIARAGAAGPDARREATWIVASDKVRLISTHLRRHGDVRRAAEILRREPKAALGEGLDAANAHTLTSAYLLVDAALG